MTRAFDKIAGGLTDAIAWARGDGRKVRAARWLKENRAALDSANAWIDANGLPLAELHPSMAVHPGPWLRRNVIDPHKLTVTEAAERLCVSRPAMSDLLNGKADLSPAMALRFELAFGLGAETLLRMQAAHDLAQARREADRLQVERIAEPA